MVPGGHMVSTRWSYLALGFWLSATVFAQNPLLDASKAPAEPRATGPAELPVLTPEKRADILMARKMYREAAETYKEGPLHSALIQNKIGIAYHQMRQTDVDNQ